MVKKNKLFDRSFSKNAIRSFIRGFAASLIGLILVLTSGWVMAFDLETQTLSRAVIKIDSLSCGGCFSTISSGLSPLEGYSGMGANLFRKLIAVDFSAPLTAAQISQKLSEVGYPGKLERVETISEKESFVYMDSQRSPVAQGGGCCSTGAPPVDNNTAKQKSPGLLPPVGGSCCTLPGVSQPTENL